MNPILPLETADVIVVASANTRPSGDATVGEGEGEVKLWIQTLNDFHMAEARREATYATALQIAKFKNNSDLYTHYMREFTDMEHDAQVAFIVNHYVEMGKLFTEAEEKYPEPVFPEKSETQSEAQYVDVVGEYHQKIGKVSNQRKTYMDKRYREMVDVTKKLLPETLVKRCMDCYLEAMFAAEFRKLMTHEILYRAVRRSDQHSRRYYQNVDDVYDLDDSIKNYLLEKYETLDTVKPKEIPTLPDE